MRALVVGPKGTKPLSASNLTSNLCAQCVHRRLIRRVASGVAMVAEDEIGIMWACGKEVWNWSGARTVPLTGQGGRGLFNGSSEAGSSLQPGVVPDPGLL